MMTWYGGHGWGWCSMLVNIPMMVALWAALVTAIVLAIRIAARQPNDPPVPTHATYPRPDATVSTRVAESASDDDFGRRLM
ncbi:SHOCT domain-containing protein [Mycobacterium sp. 663a-19]|uniref:SHOCT domain-containing protein n=1 Tax=Mycobacterium sp. 663a-19 TaxID=2986148 RepID=UPI002D1F8B8C|nr:SHOCT domain-containing protein [Mycobacterium sp. 663a-19]MEB3980397.1 SHOCT domain-containing protein [Mycobacterium sp. 663a-19]